MNKNPVELEPRKFRLGRGNPVKKTCFSFPYISLRHTFVVTAVAPFLTSNAFAKLPEVPIVALQCTVGAAVNIETALDGDSTNVEQNEGGREIYVSIGPALDARWDSIASVFGRRPALMEWFDAVRPGDVMKMIAETHTINMDDSNGAIELDNMFGQHLRLFEVRPNYWRGGYTQPETEASEKRTFGLIYMPLTCHPFGKRPAQ